MVITSIKWNETLIRLDLSNIYLSVLLDVKKLINNILLFAESALLKKTA